MKLETIAIGSRSLSKSNLLASNNENQISNSNKFSNESSSISSTSSTSSNRTNCVDYDFDTDLSEYCINQSKSNEKAKLENNPKIVSIHHHNLLANFNTEISNTKRRVC